MCVTHTIGEDSFVLQWQRDTRTRALLLKNNTNAFVSPIPSQFHIHVDQMTQDGTSVDHDVHSYHLDEVVSSTEVKQDVEEEE